MRFIFVRPKHDTGTIYSHYISLDIKDKFENNAQITTFKDLSVGLALRSNFISELRTVNKPLFVVGFGHGECDLFYGQNRDVLFNCDDKELFKDNIFYLFSCNCGVKLGKEIINAGGKGFLGYEGILWLNGFLLETFKKIITESMIIMPNGNTKLNSIYDETFKVYTNEMENALDELDFEAYNLLEHNRDLFVMYGDENLKMSDFFT